MHNILLPAGVISRIALQSLCHRYSDSDVSLSTLKSSSFRALICCTAVLIQGIHTKSNTERIHNFVTFSFAMPWSTSTRSKPNQSSRPGNSNTVTAVVLQAFTYKDSKNQENLQDSNSTYSSTGIAALNSSAVLVLYTAVPSTPGQLTHHVQQYSRKAVLQYIYIFCGTPSVYNRNLSFRNKRLLQNRTFYDHEGYDYRQKQELWEL